LFKATIQIFIAVDGLMALTTSQHLTSAALDLATLP